MPQSRPAVDSDRLPWLEPYREPATPKRKAEKPKPKLLRRTDRTAAVIIGSVMLVGGVATGFWLGRQSEQPRAVETVAVPPPRQEPARVAAAPKVEPKPVEASEQAPPAKTETESPKAAKAVSPRKPARRWIAAKKRIRATAESSRLAAVRAAQERGAPQSTWPKMPSPGPAGQVIQLGAFSHPDRAYAAYQARVARYPALASMPRVIVPVARGRNGSLLYVLRLGTTSRQQSNVICRNLRRSGDHCLVIG